MSQKPTKSKSMDMTEGSIAKLLIAFSLPLLLGNIFQQLYNTVDSLVVGNFVGKEALAAVGSTGPVINTLITFFNGVSLGATVIISRYFGAHDEEKLHSAIETTLALTFLSGIFCTFLGSYAAPWLLRFMDTPEDVMPAASTYLRIYFAGVSGLLLYNMGSGILRAVGDTKRPLYFLILSSVMNIVLDLVFVIAFDMGIAGVAYATIISQFVSAILILILLTKTKEVYRFVWKDLQINLSLVKQICAVGMPAGLQQAITTFASQNIGAGNLERAKKGTHTALLMSVAISFSISGLLWIFAPQFAELFSQENDVVSFCVLFLRQNIFFFVTSSLTQVYSGTLRGAGNSTTPMIIMLTSYVAFRQVYLYIVKQVCYIPSLVGFGYPAGWMVCALLTTLYYWFSGWDKKVKIKTKQS